jgi:uncharacterized protein
MEQDSHQFVGFVGTQLVGRGSLAEVALAAKRCLDRGATDRIAVFDDSSGRAIDVELTGSADQVAARVAQHPALVSERNARRGPGRPRLGVVSREVSLLPRHWDWLAEQRGGASAALRRLVDAASKANASQDAVRLAIEAAHRFMWDMAGNLPGFEEASRALFAQDFDAFEQRSSSWPQGIREQLHRYVVRATDSHGAQAS